MDRKWVVSILCKNTRRVFFWPYAFLLWAVVLYDKRCEGNTRIEDFANAVPVKRNM